MGVTCSNQMKLLLGIMPLLIVFAFPILKIKIWFGVVSGFELFFSSRILAKVGCVFPMVSTLRITDQMTTRKTHPTLLSLPRNIKLECMEALNIEENKLPSAFDLSHCSKNWFPFFSEHSRSVHRRRKAGSTARNTWRSDDDKNSSYLKNNIKLHSTQESFSPRIPVSTYRSIESTSSTFCSPENLLLAVM